MNQQFLMMLKGLQPEELVTLQEVTKDMSEAQQQQFMMLYQGKRKDEQTMMIFTLLGFFGVAGVQRFVFGDIALGIAYLLTAGFCFIGTIIDLVNIRRMTSEYNQRMAMETAQLMSVMR